MKPDLSDRYNDGLVPAPETPGEPPRLRPPAWRPTPAQVDLARKGLGRNLATLLLLVCACLVLVALAAGWRP